MINAMIIIVMNFVLLFSSSFGLQPATPLQLQSPLPPNQSASTSLALNTQGQIQKMEPLTNLQVT